MLLLSAEDSLLLIVDAQSKLLSILPDADSILWNLERLAKGAKTLSVPRHATEQYPEKLGPTDPRIVPLLSHADDEPPGPVPGKLSFSCCGSNEFLQQLSEAGRRQIVITGIETHVCVMQTALELIGDGFDVFLCVDAVGARNAIDTQIALRRMELAGVTLVTTESVLFEWCRVAGTDEFKQISKLVRQQPPS